MRHAILATPITEQRRLCCPAGQRTGSSQLRRIAAWHMAPRHTAQPSSATT